jgi:tRNA pseudouridine13 synthase
MTDLPLDFSYQHTEPIASATIRQQPSDFFVQELPLMPPSGEGEHVYLFIEKTSANTHWVAQQIAEHCDIRALDVGYAGRKDRHAITRQWFSCYLPGVSGPDWSVFTAEGVELLTVTRHTRKLRKGDLLGNQFVLQLRDVPTHLMSDVEAALQNVASDGFPNYFGEQRFGRNGQNLVQADEFLNSSQRHRPGKDMLISAARSYLYNLYLSNCLRQGEVPETGPLYGMSRDPQPGECELSAELQGWIAGLRHRRVKTGERQMMVKPGAMTWQAQQTSIELKFTLPPGSYATSLLREVVNTVDRSTAVEAVDEVGQ